MSSSEQAYVEYGSCTTFKLALAELLATTSYCQSALFRMSTNLKDILNRLGSESNQKSSL
jgi:hypothetical protein